MGYRISTLKNLPSNFGCYYFLIGEYRNHSVINDLFREDFRIIADQLGETNAIIESTDNGDWEYELVSSLCNHPALFTKIPIYENRLPGLLIMWKHPSNLEKNDAVVYIPFKVLEDTYSNSSDLLWDLVFFAKGKNKDLIKKTKKKYKIIKGLSLSVNVGIFALNIDL